MQNRHRQEIVRDILNVCNGGAIITKIMFHTYITHSQAKAYLAELIETGLIVDDRFEKQYKTTPKGMEYFSALESMHEMLAIETRKARIIP